MNKLAVTVVLVAAALVVDTQAQTIINPSTGTAVDTYPATFSCSNNMLLTRWYVNGMLLDNNTNTVDLLGLQYGIVGTIQENITIFGFFPDMEVPSPESVILSCGRSLDSTYANFTLIIPPLATTEVPTMATTVEPTTLPTTVEPTTMATTVEPTTMATTVEPTTMATTVEPTTLATTISPTTQATTVEPTTLATTVEPTTLATTVEPTTLATTVEPTTLGTTVEPTTLATTIPPTTQATTVEPTTLATTVEPTTLATTVEPTTLATTVEPTTLATTVEPTTLVTTVEPTTLATTIPPTTQATTVEPTTLATTVEPTTLATTVEPTTLARTVEPTTLATTIPPTTQATTVEPTTLATTVEPTTLATTVEPTTLATTVEPTTLATTVEPTTMATTVEPTTMATTVEPTTQATTVEPTTLATTVEPTTMATTVEPTTQATTVEPTTMATTVEPTTLATTIPPTTQATTVPPTTMATTVEPTTLATTIPPTTQATTVPPTLATTVDPPTGTVVDTYPATFSCLNNNQPTRWYVNGMLLDSNTNFLGSLGILYEIVGSFQENITISDFFLPNEPMLPPSSVVLSCGSLGPTYANFTLNIPPPLLATVNFRDNVTAVEGSVATLCMDLSTTSESFSPSTPFTIGLQVSPLSSATAGVDYDNISSSLVFSNLFSQCFNVSIRMDDDNLEDVETIRIIPTTNPEDSPNVGVNMFFGSLAIIRIATCSENAVRLADGADSAQGRVEICRDGDWRSICFDFWDFNDAQVVCRQLGFNGLVSAYANNYGAPFGQGGQPALTNVQCRGTEADLLQCNSIRLTLGETCSSGGRGVAIDCAGRFQPTFSIEPRAVTAVEGSSVNACVTRTSGTVSVPTEIRVERSIVIRVTPSNSLANLSDFKTSPPINTTSGQLSLVFFPGDNRQCFTVNITDDTLTEGTELLFLDIDTSSPFLVSRITITVLDNDISCVNGSRACVDLRGVRVYCTPAENVCNGFQECPDNSDETNCTVICPDQGQYCLSEGKCLEQSIRCDSYTDCLGIMEGTLGSIVGTDEFEGCPDGCVPGFVDLVGGVREREGAVRVCMNGNRVPVSATGLSILEASLLCRESGLGQVGYPGTTINFFGFQTVSPFPYLAAISCPDTATSLSQCNITTTDIGNQAAIACMETAENCTDGRVRVVSGDGLESREGRVEVCYRGVWGAILDDNWTNRDAAVVCREMGYPAQDAMPIFGAVYSDEPLGFVAESFCCVGNESQLIDCPSPFPLGRPASVGNLQADQRHLFNVAGVRCSDVNQTCTDYDVKLTYRDVTGRSGQLEICKNGTWHRTCSSTFSPTDIQVACNQLFGVFIGGEELSVILRQADVISETESYFTDSLACRGQETRLSDCLPPPLSDEGQPPPSSDEGSSPPPIGRRRRKRMITKEGATCFPSSQPTVMCPGNPVILVTPISSGDAYNVENRRSTYVQCASLSSSLQVEPVFQSPRLGKRDVTSTTSSRNFARRVIDNPVTPRIPRNYVCSARQLSSQLIEESSPGLGRTLSFQVLEGQGEPEFAFLQFSIVNRERFVTIPFITNEFDFIQTSELFINGLIHARTPGIQRVSCEYIQRRPIDVERGLDRIECEIVHYNRPDQTVRTTPTLIAERLRILLPLTLPFIVDTTIREHPQVAFTSPETIVVEGDGVVTICLTVVQGVVTTPTNITLTTVPDSTEEVIPDFREPQPLVQVDPFRANIGSDYNVSVPYTSASDTNILLTLTLQPDDTNPICFDVDIVDDDVFDGESDRAVEQVTFSYSSSSPTVARVNLRHTIVILDNDRNCIMEEGNGSRICFNIEAPAVTCIIPSRVCNYEMDCPDASDELNCPSPLTNLVNQTITVETYTNISRVVSSFAILSSNQTFLQTTDFLTDISTVFDSLANFTTTANITINETVVTDMGETLNSLVQWQRSTLIVNFTSRIVAMFEAVATQFAQQANLTDVFTNITVITELGSTATFAVEGATQNFTDQAGVSASIILPPSLFDQVPGERQFIGVYFALYGEPALLPVTSSLMMRENVSRSVGTPIVAATVGPGIDFSGLDPPVVITLGLLSLPDNTTTNPRTARCVSWDFETVSWIMDGCTIAIVDNTTFNCSCTHLTNFAVLIDICQRAQDCENDETLEAILSAITFVGVAISCVGLVITIITLLVFSKLRARDNSKYHIQLSIAILCMLIVFAVGIERIEVYGGCVFVSILIHYFSLVAVMWMGAEALLMFQKLVIVFMRITTKFLIILSLICWLFPLIFVLIPMIIDLADGTTPETDLIITRNVDPFTGDIIGGFCFLKHPGVFFGAFLAPIFAVLLFNLVIFIWVIVILVKHTCGQVKRSNENMKPKTVFRLLVSISGVMFLFGLTWLFAAFTFQIGGDNILRTIFQILFTVFASFQGFFIFLFFCVFNTEARESWREFLSCGRYKSSLLHPSQYKNSSSAGTGTRTHKAKTGTSAASSSTVYNSATLEKAVFNSEASPISEKRDLSKKEDRYTEIPLTIREATAEESVSTFKGTSGNTVEQDASRGKVETSLSSTRSAEEGVSTFSPPDIVVECQVDGDDNEKTPPNWSDASPVVKARVKRYSTKKVSKHHIEEYEVDFEEDGSDEEVAQA